MRQNIKKLFSLVLAISLGALTTGCSGDLDIDLPEFSFSSTEDNSLESSIFIESATSENASQDGSFEDVESADVEDSSEVIVSEELSIHFLHLGNQYTGDCTLIKVGDTEVLIDAGSRKGSAATIVPYIEEYCTDGVLEYVIATHAHQDHIAGFVGTTSVDGIFESFVCETIIDYARTDTTTKIREGYESLRDQEVENGATHYTVLECWNNENGAKRSYSLSDTVTMHFLYQKFYETKSSDENNYSVCMLLTQGENNYLFTGDLEKAGEESLVESNNLPKCQLFKGGHHGSPTSNTEVLLAKIQPEIVCVCCCCGSTEYTSDIANVFPSQTFVDRVAPYTDRVYVTSIISPDGKSGLPMNGNIVLTSYGEEISVNCSNNNILFKDTDWFKENRIMPDAWK